MTIEDIIDRIEQQKEQNKKLGNKAAQEADNRSDKWKPITIDDYVVPEFKIVESKAKGAEAKRRDVLSKILTFVHLAQKRRVSNACTIMPIAVTANENLAIWGSEMNVSRAIDKMIEIGLISQHNEEYRFNAPFPYDDENKCKTYKYYYENEQKFINYCKNNNIKEFEPVNHSKLTEKVKETIDKVNSQHRDFKIEDVVFSSNLKLIKPIDVSVAEFEVYLTYCLYNNYPEFEFHQIKVDEINENYYKDYPEFAIRFKPNFKWNKKKTTVEKIGIRATNSFCNKEKAERDKVLEEYGLKLQRDIKSSVPRLTLSLNMGRWEDELSDIYELINNEFDPQSEFNDKRREAIKALHMAAYFEEHSDAFMGKNIWHRILKAGANKAEVYDLMKSLRNAITKVEGGKLYGSEIFYVESCVYLMTLYDLFSAGHMVWLVYDAFYSKGESEQEDFDLMITNGVRLNFEAFYERSKFKKKVENF